MYADPNLKSAITDTLVSIINTGCGSASSAEEALKALEVTETYGLCLVELVVSSAVDDAIRQMSALLLKQYVHRHWCRADETNFTPPETPPNVKEAVRRTLPVGLGDANSKVRNGVAIALSEVARYDWPEEWPDLFEVLMRSLAGAASGGQEGDMVHGVMRALREISQEVTDVHFPQVAPVILPVLAEILAKGQVYSPRTRTRVLYVMYTLTDVAVNARLVNTSVANDCLLPYLSPALSEIVATLETDNPMVSDPGLKKEAVKLLGELLVAFPKFLGPHRDHILAVVWSLLTRTVAWYVRESVRKPPNADCEESEVDSDGNKIGLDGLVYALIEFVDKLATSADLKKAVRTSLDELVYYLMQLSQLTASQCLEWSEDLDVFIEEEEDDDPLTCTVRIAVDDLLFNLLHTFRVRFTSALCSACGRMLSEADQLREAGPEAGQFWWKLHETVMRALAKCRRDIIEAVKEGKLQFDVQAFVRGVVLPNMGMNEFPFLQCAALHCASRYAVVLSTDLIGSFLEATVSALAAHLPDSIRVCAAKALFQYADFLKDDKQKDILRPHLANIFDGLMGLCAQHGEQVFGLAMQTLCIAVEVDPEVTASFEDKLGRFLLSAIVSYANSPSGLMECESLFRALSANPRCHPAFQARMLPSLLAMVERAQKASGPGGSAGEADGDCESDLKKATRGDAQDAIGQAASVLELLAVMVRTAPTPLSEPLMMQAFPLVVHTTLSSEDATCVQNGADCLRAFVSTAHDQVASWHDNRGNTGVMYILQVVSRLLSPKSPDSYAVRVGRLISVLLAKAWPHLGENIDLLLRAVLGKLNAPGEKLLSVKQSLLMVFAQLSLHHLEELLEFLSSVPDITGQPALQSVLITWCNSQHLFFGKYDVKISILALCALVQHTVKSNDVRLQEVLTAGDPINEDTGAGVRTRRQCAAKPTEFQQIPVIVKMYKLLINELHRQIEEKEATDTEEEDEEDEEEENGGGITTEVDDGYIRTLVDAIDDEEYMEELAADDPDAASDPLNQVDLHDYLRSFLQELSQQPYFHLFAQHHNSMEQTVLRGIGISNV